MTEFANKTSTKASLVVGVVFLIAGFVCLMFQTSVAVGFWVVAVVAFFLLRHFASDTTVSCYENEFIVRKKSRSKGESVRTYKWDDVTETTYYEKESGGDDSTTTRYFKVETKDVVAFNVYASKGFDELIKLVNERTPHLPYEWIKTKGIFGTYQKQERLIEKE